MNTAFIGDISSFTVVLMQDGYIAGVIIAILILGYLVFNLIKPEKF
jgi:K+-transporting ATPase KdpF subunit